jgi:hypothetical protein
MGQRLLTATEKVWKVGPGQNILSFVEATMHLLFPLLLIIGSPMATPPLIYRSCTFHISVIHFCDGVFSVWGCIESVLFFCIVCSYLLPLETQLSGGAERVGAL